MEFESIPAEHSRSGSTGAGEIRTAAIRRSAAVRSAKPAAWPAPAALASADLLGLALALLVVRVAHRPEAAWRAALEPQEVLLLSSALGIWGLGAIGAGLYRRDCEEPEHSTVDDVVPVVLLATTMCWVLALGSWSIGSGAGVAELGTLWLAGIGLVLLGRSLARMLIRRRGPLQRALIVGAGDIGQLVARKLLKHPEYGIELVGLVDSDPKRRRSDLDSLTILGTPEQLSDTVRTYGIERVIFAFSRESAEQVLPLARSVQDLGLQVDVVPRLFEAVGPGAAIRTVEGLPLVGLPTAKRSPAGMLVKRSLDVVGAVVGLVLTAPLFAVIAWRIKRDSEGPVLFRQTRLTAGMQPFTALKFRTMKTSTDASVHREYIESALSNEAAPGANGLFKADQSDSVTSLGRWLRTTSLDELPQLVNVLRGDMSLVGPRPSIPYETAHFQPYHYERFRVRAGLTGLWQVTARANASFAEALDMDVAYVRSASLGLDLRLLCRTPAELLRQRRSTT